MTDKDFALAAFSALGLSLIWWMGYEFIVIFIAMFLLITIFFYLHASHPAR